MIERKVVVGPFQCNCRLLVCRKSGEALLVDPGDESGKILREIQDLRADSGLPIQVKYLLHTHAHLDHIGGTRGVREGIQQTDAPRIAVHRGDEPLYLGLREQGRLFRMNFDDPLPIQHFLEDGETLAVGEMKFSVLHTPGHSPGSVCFRLHEDSGAGVMETVFSGDTLFKSSVGRTDLWGGSTDQMFKSIRERLLILDGDTRLCPGHGPDSSIGVEKTQNPFLT